MILTVGVFISMGIVLTKSMHDSAYLEGSCIYNNESCEALQRTYDLAKTSYLMLAVLPLLLSIVAVIGALYLLNR